MNKLLVLLLALSFSHCDGFTPGKPSVPRSVVLLAKGKPKQKAPPASSRQNRIASLMDWAKSTADIQATGGIELKSDVTGGLGWFAKSPIPAGSVVLTVPPSVALSVEAPGGGPDDRKVISTLVKDEERKTFRDMPWYVQMSLYLFKLDKVDSTKESTNMRTWLDSLPRNFDTPIHWSSLEDLQYSFMADSVQRQEQEWKVHFEKLSGLLSSSNKPTWEDFLWGCECARSRAFSGAYSGNAFNPLIYAFTLLLVTAYVGLGLGTLEQAANGAGVVVSVSILNDFVIPKLFSKGKKKYIVCPMMDMANHRSLGTSAAVSFEYFGNVYSLATESTVTVSPGEEIYISYGTRSNDQLLQYYGFVEPNNPHDVYVMPPLRDWDIQALEEACGRTFSAGRLGKLDRAGLLGGSPVVSQDDEAANTSGGVVVTRVNGVDPAVVQALRALVSTEEEWKAAGEAIGNFADVCSEANERTALLAAKTALQLELEAKSTTIEQDEDLMVKLQQMKTAVDREDVLAVQFRLEKKKLLRETINNLS